MGKSKIIYFALLCIIIIFITNTYKFKQRNNRSIVITEVIHNAIVAKNSLQNEEIRTYGKIESGSNIDITSETSGRIVKMIVNRYDFVRKNQKIFQIMDDINQNINYSKLDMPDIETDLDPSYQKLISTSKRQNKNNDRYITSPCNGYLKDTFIEEGGAVYSSGAGNKVASIACTDKLYISSSISATNAANIKSGLNAAILINEKSIPSKVKSVSRVLNESGSVNITLDIPSKYIKDIFINSTIDIRIFLNKAKCFSINHDTLYINSDGEVGVYVVSKEETAYFRKVGIVKSDANNVCISGVNDNEIIITSAMNLVKNGNKVKYALPA